MRSPVVRPGDTVRLVSPASYPTREWLTESIGILRGWGLDVASTAPGRPHRSGTC
jgi:muramoyltetrapeptide carboxypeptidase